MPFGGLLTVGLISAGGSIVSGLLGKSAATKAAEAQQQSAADALNFQKQVYSDQKANQQPYVQAGQSSIGQLMKGLSDGTFGNLPAFKAPTAEEARATPGYQFTQDQGNLGIERGAAAAGGAFTGGTLKSLAGFNSGLADSTYNSTFSRALSTYQALMSSQQQSYNQLAGVASLGENAAANVGNNGTAAANNAGQLLTGAGNAQAAGIIGGANAITGAIGGATSAATTPFYLNYLQQGQNLPSTANGGIPSNGWYAPGGGGYAPPVTTPPFIDGGAG
jgi:hypothetical protein